VDQRLPFLAESSARPACSAQALSSSRCAIDADTPAHPRPLTLQPAAQRDEAAIDSAGDVAASRKRATDRLPGAVHGHVVNSAPPRPAGWVTPDSRSRSRCRLGFRAIPRSSWPDGLPPAALQRAVRSCNLLPAVATAAYRRGLKTPGQPLPASRAKARARHRSVGAAGALLAGRLGGLPSSSVKFRTPFNFGCDHCNSGRPFSAICCRLARPHSGSWLLLFPGDGPSPPLATGTSRPSFTVVLERLIKAGAHGLVGLFIDAVFGLPASTIPIRHGTTLRWPGDGAGRRAGRRLRRGGAMTITVTESSRPRTKQGPWPPERSQFEMAKQQARIAGVNQQLVQPRPNRPGQVPAQATPEQKLEAARGFMDRQLQQMERNSNRRKRASGKLP